MENVQMLQIEWRAQRVLWALVTTMKLNTKGVIISDD